MSSTSNARPQLEKKIAELERNVLIKEAELRTDRTHMGGGGGLGFRV